MAMLTGGSSGYMLLDKLGEGNFSSVFKAQCLGQRRGSTSCCPVAAIAATSLHPSLLRQRISSRITVTSEGHHVVAVKKIKQKLARPPPPEDHYFSPSCRAASFFAVTPLRRERHVQHDSSIELSSTGIFNELSNCGSLDDNAHLDSGCDNTRASHLSHPGYSAGGSNGSRSNWIQSGSPDASVVSHSATTSNTAYHESARHDSVPENRQHKKGSRNLSTTGESSAAKRHSGSGVTGTATTTADSGWSYPDQSFCLTTAGTKNTESKAVLAGKQSRRGGESESNYGSPPRWPSTGSIPGGTGEGFGDDGSASPAAYSLVYKEIGALRKLNPHEHIVQMFDCFIDNSSKQLCIVTELMERSLLELLESFHGNGMEEGVVRSLLYQALLAVDHVHKNGFIHRDIKPENFLVCSKGSILKLADFGCCRTVTQSPPYTEYIATRWYRPPECLMAPGYYSKPMDIWGLGCLMFELLTGRPLFPGRDETEQLERIEQVLGPLPSRLCRRPSASVLLSLKSAQQNVAKASRLRSLLFPDCSSAAVDLMHGLLAYDPASRMEPSCALLHPFFNSVRCPGLEASKLEPLKCWEEACQLIDSLPSRGAASDAIADFREMDVDSAEEDDEGSTYSTSAGFPGSDSSASVKYYSATTGWAAPAAAAASSPSLASSSSSSSAITTVTPPPRQEASSPANSPEATEVDSRFALPTSDGGKLGRSASLHRF